MTQIGRSLSITAQNLKCYTPHFTLRIVLELILIHWDALGASVNCWQNCVRYRRYMRATELASFFSFFFWIMLGTYTYLMLSLSLPISLSTSLSLSLSLCVSLILYTSVCLFQSVSLYFSLFYICTLLDRILFFTIFRDISYIKCQFNFSEDIYVKLVA